MLPNVSVRVNIDVLSVSIWHQQGVYKLEWSPTPAINLDSYDARVGVESIVMICVRDELLLV